MFVVVKKRQVIVAAILIFALLCAVGCGMGFGLKGKEDQQAMAKKLLPVYAVSTDQKEVALTFDAAWGSDKTGKILDILDEYGVKATFFLVGFWIEANPLLTQEIMSRGHLIGNHSKDHPHMPTLGADKMTEQIESVNGQIEELTGTKPTFFRAPFGDYDNTLISLLDEIGMVGVQWDVDSLDWKGGSGGEISQRILTRVRPGSIILCHNNSDHILDALPIVLLGLKNKGYKVVRIDELVQTSGYEIDSNGIQRKST